RAPGLSECLGTRQHAQRDAMGGLPVERLRDYLRQLPLGVRARLIAELERAAARGDDIPGGAAVLEEGRGTMQESAPAPRRGLPRELFFKAVEPFLVDDLVEQKRRGRIARRRSIGSGPGSVATLRRPKQRSSATRPAVR